MKLNIVASFVYDIDQRVLALVSNITDMEFPRRLSHMLFISMIWESSP